MKKRVVLISAVAAAASFLIAGPTAMTPAQEMAQAEPYTMANFGPWNEAVAKTHVPMVTFEKTGMGLKVTIQVDNHPMDPQTPHWIEWIRLEDAMGKTLVEKTFKATDPRPAIAVFELPAMTGKVRALEHCNIHGTWLNEAAIEIK